MLIKSAKQITQISENQEINSQNYLEVIPYINNLYDVITLLKPIISIHNSVFLPTFKGKYTCVKYNIASTNKENELKVFAIKTLDFLEDFDNAKKETLFDILHAHCQPDSIKFDNESNIVEFILL